MGKIEHHASYAYGWILRCPVCQTSQLLNITDRSDFPNSLKAECDGCDNIWTFTRQDREESK